MTESAFDNGCAWIAGEYLPIDQATIPITDTGFTRSDVTYDVVAVWGGKFFRLDKHLDRFERAWRGLNMNPPLSKNEMRDILFSCVAKSGIRDAYVEMMVTRGVPPQGDRDPRNFQNRFYAFAIPYVWVVEPAEQETGISLAIAEQTRRISPRSVDPTIKNFHWGDLTRGLYEALERGAKTAVLLDEHGLVTEGPGFNVFMFRDGRLVTPKNGVLLGITRQTVLELAEEQDIDCELGDIDVARLRSADEIFLTSTAGGIMPVAYLDGKPVGEGKPGPLTLALRERYWQAHDDPNWTEEVHYEPGTSRISAVAG